MVEHDDACKCVYISCLIKDGVQHFNKQERKEPSIEIFQDSQWNYQLKENCLLTVPYQIILQW